MGSCDQVLSTVAVMRTSHRLHAVLATAIVSTVVAAALVLSGPAAVAKPASITTSYGCAPFDQYPVTGTTSVNLPAQVRPGGRCPTARCRSG